MNGKLLVLLSLVAFAWCVPTLPTLYQIQKYEFSVPYGCDGGNYTTSALFLSSESLRINEPDLLYYGACGYPQFWCATGGNDLCFIANLGSTALEDLTPQNIVHYPANYEINRLANLEVHTTYSVIGAKSDFRYMMVFTLDSLDLFGPASITYSVFLYEEQTITKQSPGFDWGAHPGQMLLE